MPDQPRPDNRAHPVRMDDELWQAVRDRAARDEVTASEVVRSAVRSYLGLE